MTKIAGYCPMGCGDTLFIGDGGYITCSWVECKHPTAVADILDDRETEHVVVLDEDSFSIQHPLRERLNGELFDCALHGYLLGLSGPPRQPGRYRSRQVEDGEWDFTALAPTPNRREAT